MNVKLERIVNGVALRTREVVGDTDALPCVGRQFVMIAPPLDPTVGNIRLVETSPVVEIVAIAGTDKERTSTTFRTENSIYRLTKLPE